MQTQITICPPIRIVPIYCIFQHFSNKTSCPFSLRNLVNLGLYTSKKKLDPSQSGGSNRKESVSVFVILWNTTIFIKFKHKSSHNGRPAKVSQKPKHVTEIQITICPFPRLGQVQKLEYTLAARARAAVLPSFVTPLSSPFRLSSFSQVEDVNGTEQLSNVDRFRHNQS